MAQNGGNNVLESGNDALNGSDVLLQKSKQNLRRGRRRTCGRVWGDCHRGRCGGTVEVRLGTAIGAAGCFC